MRNRRPRRHAMVIVLNHITRMRGSRICVAGIDRRTGRHVRPTTGPTDKLDRTLLAGHGGPFALGAAVDLGPASPAPEVPESEDHRFTPAAARAVGRLDRYEYLHLLDGVSRTDLHSIFGPALTRHTWKLAVDVGAGAVSLGVLRPTRRPTLEIDRRGRPQLKLRDLDQPPAYVPVTDVRFVEEDHRTVKRATVEDVVRRMSRGVDTLLMVGLSRAFRAKDGDPARHWLQVNGICLADRPLGDRP
jgi:hypothetical protein